MGGSWYVEKLTQDLEEEAEAYLEKIRSLGGMLQAIESGYVQREIQEAAYGQQARLESGAEIVVGVNRFESERLPSKSCALTPRLTGGKPVGSRLCERAATRIESKLPWKRFARLREDHPT